MTLNIQQIYGIIFGCIGIGFVSGLGFAMVADWIKRNKTKI